MAVLGDDGHGYDLARKLESCGVWRTWLGDSTYTNLAPFLSSPSAWDSFMRTDSSKSRAHIHLQLRVRALLFDKAISSSLSSNPNPSLSRINPNFLLLHPDDIYFTLDNNPSELPSTSSKNQSKTGSRYVDSELDSVSQRYELPETWYNQVIEKYKANKKLVLGNRDSAKRSPEEMASYIVCVNNNKKRRAVFKDDQQQVMDQSNGGGLIDGNGGGDNDEIVFPEMMYAWNNVPESALPMSNRMENNNNNPKLRIFSVLDTLPPVMTRNPVMIERLGIRGGENVNGEHGRGLYRGKVGTEGSGRVLSHEQAAKLSQKVVARILLGVGFDGAMEAPIECLSEVMSKHVVKIGTNLKILVDSYKKQCSAIELLKMLLKTVGFSNFTPLVDVVKDGSRNIVHQNQQHIHGTQSQMQLQQQSSLRLPQQVQMQRQIHPQMQQFINSQNLTFQQQQQLLERMRSHQSTRPAMDINKERPMVQVKLENPSDLPNDGNAFNPRQTQMQFRQQQLAAMSGFHSQSNTPTQYRQMASLQIPSIQSPNSIGMVRAPPVKVEGFQELMGGDSSSKHDSEENRLTSPR